MNGRARRGLVVGKFSPLHRGHEAILRRAMEACEEVVAISYANPEVPGCDPATRERWFTSLFPAIRHKAAVNPPRDDEDETTHRRFCGSLCRTELGGPVDAVITGEPYGDGFAEELTRYFRSFEPSAAEVRHIRVDRDLVPTSGSMIRRDVHAHREWLSPVVYASFVRRICILGGESTGKSTLTGALAGEFGTKSVAEYGRELWERKGGALAFDDMERIAREQVDREERALQDAVRFVFCDTSPLTTFFYSLELFARASPDLMAMADRTYGATFLCAPDFPFVQDGTRQPSTFRDRQHQWYLRELERRNISFVEVQGTLDARIRKVRETLTV